MEFRCRVATASGQIMEATYVAEDEARLRHELEEKGLFLLSVQHGGSLKIGKVGVRLPRRRKVGSAEFLVFNQELATLLKAGLPLVQSLDILRRRIENPMFKSALDDVYDKVRSGSSLSEAFEVGQPGTGAAAVRPARQGVVVGAPARDLGADLSRRPRAVVDVRRHADRLQGRSAVQELL
jgi:type II secretory pathway component PulF